MDSLSARSITLVGPVHSTYDDRITISLCTADGIMAIKLNVDKDGGRVDGQLPDRNLSTSLCSEEILTAECSGIDDDHNLFPRFIQ